MPANELQHLISLIAAAEAEARRLGPLAGALAGTLAEAGAEARSLVAQDGRPDEGLRPEDLTTANDK